jgi:dephospho-CoA kinase
MLKIGITGGIGSGKTTVCKVFELLGVPVYNADDEAKKIIDTPTITAEIRTAFGEKILTDNKFINRKELAAVVFQNKEALAKLNSIVHPAVGAHFEAWVTQQKSRYIIKEAAILFESGAYQQVNQVITVVSPIELRIQRILKRNSITRTEVEERIRNQWSDEEKIKRSQHILLNDEQALLLPQILKLHALLNG